MLLREVFAKMALFANTYGNDSGKPYFNLTAEELVSSEMAASKWDKLQSVFNFEYGATNVWNCPANRGRERLKDANGKTFHSNQKPEILMKRIISAGSDAGDVVWDVFCSSGVGASIASSIDRNVFTAENNSVFVENACLRLGLQ